MLTNSRDIVRRLEKEGWCLARSKGSHHHFRKAGQPGVVTVPHPKKDLPIKTVKSIYRQAGWKND
jgi:predicted RNA binding protein YcfA (HicA-like mRNA interferase family)